MKQPNAIRTRVVERPSKEEIEAKIKEAKEKEKGLVSRTIFPKVSTR